MVCSIQSNVTFRPNACFCFPSESRLHIESSQQVAVAERLRKREPSQLAPGMAFLLEIILLLMLKIKESKFHCVYAG